MPVKMKVLKVKRETAKSRCMDVALVATVGVAEFLLSREIWVPKSLSKIEGDVLSVRTWFFEKALKGLVHEDKELEVATRFVTPKEFVPPAADAVVAL